MRSPRPSIPVLVGVIVALLISTLPGLDEVRERFAHAEAGWLVVLFFLEVASCLSYVVAFRGVFCTRLGWRFSYEIGMAEQGTNVLVPAGGVVVHDRGVIAWREGGGDAQVFQIVQIGAVRRRERRSD